jgi:GT2 family glycosyltransferase
VAVVCPFAGDGAAAAATARALATIRTAPGDELVLVDNNREAVEVPPGPVRVVRAPGQASSYFARNAGAAATSAPWMLFVDADCRPHPGILDAFFAPAPAGGTGAVAGAVLDARGPGTVVGGWSEAVGVLSQTGNLAHPWRPFAVTANLLVRREAFDAVGGFAEGIRSGGDADFSWRLQAAGHELEFRARAAVEHRHRDTLRELVRQYRRYGGGIAWAASRHPASGGPWLAPSARQVRLAATDLAAGRFRLAGTRAVSLLTASVAARASAADNAAPGAGD